MLDRAILFLAAKNEPIIPRTLEDSFGNSISVNATRLLEKIDSSGLTFKSLNKMATQGQHIDVYSYCLKSDAIDFIKNIPDEFKDTPYTYYQSILSIRKEKELNNEALVNRINELTLEALQRDKENVDLKRQLDEVGLKLSEAQHADIPINAEDRETNITWQIIAGVSTIVAFLLKLFGVKGWL